MSVHVSRRRFIKTSTTLAATSLLPRFSIGQSGVAPNSRLNVACIGVGHRGFFAVSECMQDPRVQIVALCDVDRRLVEQTYSRGEQLKTEAGLETRDLSALPLFADYREMFSKLEGQIDAVTISTPDHHHYPAAMMAIQRGKHVYVEKPLAHTVTQVRALRAAARAKGIVSQMGNQGRATEGIRLMREWTKAGVLGKVREVHAWSPAFPAEFYTRPASLPLPAQPAPSTLNWDLWIGPAGMRTYHELLAPKKWRGFWDFGNGMLGDWGCHTLDGPWWALDLGAPSAVHAQVSEVNDEIVPEWAVVTYEFPARGSQPPVKLHWYEGAGKMPPVPTYWEGTPENRGLPQRGMFMLGETNTLFAPSGRPDSPRLLGARQWDELRRNRPAATIPRVKGGPFREWIDAIAAAGPLPGSNFEYSAALSEMVLLGVIAARTGKRLEWDSHVGRVTNDPSLNRYIETAARDGWAV